MPYLETVQELLEAKEGEHVQFKEAKKQFDSREAAKCCCALANNGGGKLVFGITDKRPRSVVGSAAFDQPERTRMGLIEKFGNVSAQVFMPIVPALIVGGLILSIKNLLVNYCGLSTDSGTAQVLLAIFSASFSFLPVYLGYQLAAVMKMQPIMGALLGAIMISSSISGAEGLDFLGIPIPTNDYSSTVVPIVLGVVFMYFVDRGLQKIIPDITKLFLKPLLTMFIVVPVELIILGPAGSMMGYALSDAATWLMDNVAFIATPILAALNPYFVMLGLDKAYIAIEVTSLAQLGWAPIIFGFISNLCIGGTSLALATAMKGNKEKRGMVTTVAVTALCGVTEPAFYGCLIERPRLLVGTAIGALCAGLPAGIFVLKEYVAGACPGLLSALIFIAPDGSMGNFVLACWFAGTSGIPKQPV